MDDVNVFYTGSCTYDSEYAVNMLVSKENIKNIDEAGGKGFRLKELSDYGFCVPPFVIIPASVLEKEMEIKSSLSPEEIINGHIFGQNWKDELEKLIPGAKNKWFAVRSSGRSEDGTQFSFAGQFKTKLYVSYEELENAVREVWNSAFSKTINSYTKENNLEKPKAISVVIQEMIDAEVSGVAFGINPVSGNKNEKVISSVFGLGEGIVSGELDADNYILNNSKTEKQIADKTHYLHHEGNGKLVKSELNPEKQNASTLNEKYLDEISTVLDKLNKIYKYPQDIEFVCKNNQLYLLQTRPVTATGNKKDESQYIVWDNSNIIESYPGVTTPLTFSFILSSYEGAYRLFSEYLGVDKKTIEENRSVYANTLGLINGRVYYNLKSWYQMLALLPGYSINAGYMEKMMGVKEKFEISDTYKLSKTKAWFRILKMAVKMYLRYRSITAGRKKFVRLLDNTIAEYKSINYSEKSAAEIIQLYLDFEKKLLNEWKAPLLNDFFAMIAFGSLQKKCGKFGLNKENSNIHNDLLCGSSDIISTQPIHRSIAIATMIRKEEELEKWFLSMNEKEVWKQLSEEKYPALKKEIDSYIHDFGERCIGELKLETISYSSEPSLFIKIIKSYVEGNITQKSVTGNTEEKLRKDAEEKVKQKLKFRPYRYRQFRKTLAKARELVSNRENLRYERTRAFGIVRELFSQAGKKFHELKLIAEPRDIFYLTKEEIISFSLGTSVNVKLREIISARKKEFEEYKKLPMPAERIKTYGLVYHNNDLYKEETSGTVLSQLKGIGCCPGKVTGKVRVVTDPSETHSVNGAILVTSSTDPGWVTLFPTASAIIVERGSLLSHSAIVSREMGIPCIVSVTGLLKTLKTGDLISMDGSTGEIKLLNIT